MTTSLKRKLGGLAYQRMNPRWEIAECEHKPTGWPQSRRCIVARRLIDETETEPTLFTMTRYLYLAAHNDESPAGESPAMENDDEPSRYNRLGRQGATRPKQAR
jgi:hypothetical protein